MAADIVRTMSSMAEDDVKENAANNFSDPASHKAPFLETGSLRASLYRSKRQKFHLNPSDPLTNPYRVSNHDQMPIRVIPPSPAIPSKRKNRRKSFAAAIIPGILQAKSTDHEAVPHQTKDNDDSAFYKSGIKALQPQNRTCSFDNLIQKPHYLTRNAMKRIKEQKLEVLDESTLSLSSDEGNHTQDFSNHNGLRSSKSRKSFHKFNLFSKSSKNKSVSEFALNEARSFDNLDSTVELNATTNEKEEKKRLRKRRLSGFRSRFQKKSNEEAKLVPDGKKKNNKRKSNVFRNAICEETNNNDDEALSLRDVLNNRDLCEEFRSFLAHEHSDENLDFWTICEKYRSSSNRTNLAEVIRRQFLKDGAPREVNLDGKTKSVLEENTRVLTSESFAQAQESIFRLMEEDSFRRFCSSRSSKRRKRN